MNKQKREKLMSKMTSQKTDGAVYYFEDLNDKKLMIYDRKSIHIFDGDHAVRTKIVRLLTDKRFEYFIIFVIFLNSLFLACYDYSDRDNMTGRNQMIEKAGVIFTLIFTVECILKIIAMGFCKHQNSYLKDPWNWLDFTVVCIGVIELTRILPTTSVKALRVMRVLRPLKSINSIPSMKRLIKSLLASTLKLIDSLIIICFIFVIFGILGIKQFKGVQYQRCRTTKEPESNSGWPIASDVDRLCTMDGSGQFECPPEYTCGRVIDYPEIPFSSENVQNQVLISYGYTVFDDFGSAMLTIFQMITLEGWSDLMYNLSDATSPWIVISFCIMVVILGSFFIMNLVLAVIVDAFDEVDENSASQDEKEAKHLREQLVLYGIKPAEYADDDKLDESNDTISVIGYNINASHISDGSEDKEHIPERALKNKLYLRCYLFSQNAKFSFAMIVFTIINTFILALDQHPISKERNYWLDLINNVLSLIFFCEMIIKMLGLGFRQYYQDAFNVFDCVIVSLSSIEIAIGFISQKPGGGAISAMRALRLLRIFKLARDWKSFREILERMVITIIDISNFTILMMIIIFIYTLLGLEMYAYRVKFDSEDMNYALDIEEVPDVKEGFYPRSNFNTFLTGYITVFGILIGENWNVVMYDHLRGSGRSAYLFCISAFIVGNLILLNLFLAILLKNFETPPEKEEPAEENEQALSIMSRVKSLISMQSKNESSVEDKEEPFLEGSEMKKSKADFKDRALYVLGPNNIIRKITLKIATNKVFENFILALIIFSSALLTFESPLMDPYGDEAKILEVIDFWVTMIFTFEMITKILSYGLVFNGPDSYLKSPWNILDFTIVTMSLLLILFHIHGQGGSVKIVRMMRILRPLRMINRNPGMKLVVISMINAVADLGTVIVLSTLFLMLFAILGTNLFKGTFYRCHMENIPKIYHDRIVDKIDCINYGGEWSNNDQNFDNIFASQLTLFNVMTTEGWLDVMWNAVDATKVDYEPVFDNSPSSMLYFVGFIIVGALFILNMFVGVVVNTFNQEKMNLEQNHLLTKVQHEWANVAIVLYSQKPQVSVMESKNYYKNLCQQWVLNPRFDHFIMSCIILNTICLATVWYDEPPIVAEVISYFNQFFNLVYTTEAAIKITAYGLDYFKVGWNQFDFLIVVLTAVEYVLKSWFGIDSGSSGVILRMLRVSRLFKVFKKNKNLTVLFNTFVDAWPQLCNVGAILFLFMFIYANLGVFMFGHVKLQGFLNVHANFQTFGIALLTLFRMSTGESWNFIMADCARQKSIMFDCESQDFDEIMRNGIQGCGSPMAAYMYFLSFMIVVSFIFLNLFIVVIFESFENSKNEEHLKVSTLAFEKFKKIWSDFDHKGTGYIEVEDLPPLIEQILDEEIAWVQELNEDLQNGIIEREEYEKKNVMFNLYKDHHFLDVAEEAFDSIKCEKLMRKQTLKFIKQCHLPVYQDCRCYYFHDVLERLSRTLFQNLMAERRENMTQKDIQASTRTLHETKDDIDQEGIVATLRADMDEVLRKLEEKGEDKDNNILKYNKLARLKAKRYKKEVLQNKSSFVDKKNGGKEIAIDSAHIIVGWFIANKYKEKKRLERLADFKDQLRQKKMKREAYARRSENNEDSSQYADLTSSQSSNKTMHSEYPQQRQRTSEKFINDFVDKCFYSLNLDPNNEDMEVSRLNCARLFYDLMRGHEYIDAWDDKQFHVIYDLFQEDENISNLGLDKNEFTKMIKRLAQL